MVGNDAVVALKRLLPGVSVLTSLVRRTSPGQAAKLPSAVIKLVSPSSNTGRFGRTHRGPRHGCVVSKKPVCADGHSSRFSRTHRGPRHGCIVSKKPVCADSHSRGLSRIHRGARHGCVVSRKSGCADGHSSRFKRIRGGPRHGCVVSRKCSTIRQHQNHLWQGDFESHGASHLVLCDERRVCVITLGTFRSPAGTTQSITTRIVSELEEAQAGGRQSAMTAPQVKQLGIGPLLMSTLSASGMDPLGKSFTKTFPVTQHRS